MKTRRRHELQTNVLADYLGKHLQQFKPYSRHVTIGTLLICAAILAGLYFSSKWNAERGASWSDFSAAFAANDPDALEEVAALHDGSTAALWARQAAGDMKLAMGTSQLFRDREEAAKTLRDAKEHYLAVEEDAVDNPPLVERARFGLAQVYESLSDIEKAKEYYGEVAKSSADSALSKVAKHRLDRLSDKSVERWYAWFERQEPVPPPLPPSGIGPEPKVSDNLDLLPERPDLSIPGSDSSGDAKDLMDIDLNPPAGKEDAPPDKKAAEPKPAESEATPAATEGEESAVPEPKEAAKPGEPASEPESGTEADKDAPKPTPQPEDPASTDPAKPVGKPAASDEGNAKPESKDASS